MRLLLPLLLLLLPSCGLLNGLTEGDIESPLAGLFEGEGEEGEGEEGECEDDNDCDFACDVDLGVCVDCFDNSDCDLSPDGAFCEVELGLCAECLSDADCVPNGSCVEGVCGFGLSCGDVAVCPELTPFCFEGEQCVQCVVSDNCNNGQVCNGEHVCVDVTTCVDSGDCLDGNFPFCGGQGECVECLINTDCATRGEGFQCDANGECFEATIGCTVIGDCPSGQFCDGATCVVENIGCVEGEFDEGNPMRLEGGLGANVYFVPDSGIAGTLVVVRDDLGGTDRFSNAPVCELVAAGYVVVLIDDVTQDAVVEALEQLHARYSEAHTHSALVLASSSTSFVDELEGDVSTPAVLPKRFILLSVGRTYTGDPPGYLTALAGIGSPSLWMTIQGDNACGADCVTEQEQYEAGDIANGEFHTFTTTNTLHHGLDLITNALEPVGGGAQNSQERIAQFLADTF